jgi:hypothetical protein
MIPVWLMVAEALKNKADNQNRDIAQFNKMQQPMNTGYVQPQMPKITSVFGSY